MCKKSSPSRAYLFQTSSQNDSLLVACGLIGSGSFKFNQNCYCAATCSTENANYVIWRDAGEGEKITQIELDSINRKKKLKWTLEKRKDKTKQERIREESAV